MRSGTCKVNFHSKTVVLLYNCSLANAQFSGAAPVQQRHGRGSGEALAHRREAVPDGRDKVEVSSHSAPIK